MVGKFLKTCTYQKITKKASHDIGEYVPDCVLRVLLDIRHKLILESKGIKVVKNKKVALVTGASGSIGSEIVKLFSKNSIDSVICYNSNRENSEKLFKFIEGDNLITKLDVTNQNDI